MKAPSPDLAACSRRSALKTMSVGLLALGAMGASPLSAAARKPVATGPSRYGFAPFSLPALPYEPGALAPHIDERTMEIHHGKHHQGYVSNTNRLITENAELSGLTAEELLANDLARVPEKVRTGLRNNLGGHVNHAFFWPLLAAPADYRPGKLRAAIVDEFGSLEEFQEVFAKAAATRFGSGWAWLVVRDGKLVVESTANQDSPLMNGGQPVIGLDVWEHAYYLNYQNRRGDYVKAFWNVLNWDQAEANYAAAA
ncbi:MAG: superoxide dismutase [Verrucomicrobiota bacterium]